MSTPKPASISKPQSHTPGPWHKNGDCVEDHRYCPIVRIHRGDYVRQTSDADLTLIAAAPDLLAALKAAEDALAICADALADVDEQAGVAAAQASERARAAIARATSP